MVSKHIILASASPRRAALLRQVGVPFDVSASDVPEAIDGSISGPDNATRLAHQKAASVSEMFPRSFVIGADTIGELNGEVLGKPTSEREAASMLRKLSGSTHRVITGVAILNKEAGINDLFYRESHVTFKELNKSTIGRYLRTREYVDKAGAYAIQGIGAVFVQNIEGCFYNIMGLPLCDLCTRLIRYIDEETVFVPADVSKRKRAR